MTAQEQYEATSRRAEFETPGGRTRYYNRVVIKVPSHKKIQILIAKYKKPYINMPLRVIHVAKALI